MKNKLNMAIHRLRIVALMVMLKWLGLSDAAAQAVVAYGTIAEYGIPHIQTDQTLIRGVVRDSRSGQTIPGIQIMVKDKVSEKTYFSGPYGNFSIWLPAGKAYKVVYTDIDGDMNGSFEVKDTMLMTNDAYYYQEVRDVIIELRTKEEKK